MKTACIAAIGLATLVSSANVSVAQYGDAVPIGRNYRGEPACPSNYVIRGNACVSIYAGRGRGYDDRPRRHRRDDYYSGRGSGPDVVQPRVNYRGELACPSNYIIRRGMCVSIYR